MKRLSIIIPVYNVEEYLESCIQSIVHQRVDDYEIILIDDGSTDRSGAICDKMHETYDNIVVVHKENGGVSSARNIGLSIANSEYILFVDPDDFLETDSLSAIINDLHKDVDVSIYRSYEVINGVKQREFPSYNASLSGNIIKARQVYIEGTYSRSVVWSTIFKTSFIKDNNLSFIDGMANGEDAVFMAFAFMCDPNILISSQTLYCVNIRPESASRQWNSLRVQRMVDNIILLDGKREVNEPLNNSLIDYLIYNNISCLFDYLNYSHMSISKVLKTAGLVRNRLAGRKLNAAPLERARGSIKVLNVSVFLFALLKTVINRFRN